MSTRGLLGVGTRKGLFLYDRAGGGSWSMREPVLPEWEVSALLLDPHDPDHLTIGTSHYAWGPTIRDSRDGGKTWSQTSLHTPDAEAKHPLKTIWRLQRSPDGRTLYAGVEEAALYRSDDNGESWSEVTGLTSHPSRPYWQPGGGGLCLHTIVTDPGDVKRMWVGISAVGVFGTNDGGETWKAMNAGLPTMATTGSQDRDAMFCVHKMRLDPSEPGRLYMQFHAHTMTPDGKRSSGVFTSNGAEHWEPIDSGLPDRFGFPLGVSQRGELFVIPLHGDENRTFSDGAAAVWRSRDRGANWQKLTEGLGPDPVYAGVLRDAMDVDRGEPAGVYFGTTNGDVFASADAGQRWQRLPGRLSRVHVVRAEVFDG